MRQVFAFVTAELGRFTFTRRNYPEVLPLNPTPAKGLASKKAAELRQALADGDHAEALLLDPGNTQALAWKLAAVKSFG